MRERFPSSIAVPLSAFLVPGYLAPACSLGLETRGDVVANLPVLSTWAKGLILVEPRAVPVIYTRRERHMIPIPGLSENFSIGLPMWRSSTTQHFLFPHQSALLSARPGGELSAHWGISPVERIRRGKWGARAWDCYLELADYGHAAGERRWNSRVVGVA